MLLAIWVAFLSAETGFGYMFITPFVTGGDTRQIASLTHLPLWGAFIVSALGIFGCLYVLPRLMSPRVSTFASDKTSFFAITMHPWYLGTIGLLAIYVLVVAVQNYAHIANTGYIGLMGVAA
ncbi:hypothetical protein HJC99_03045 [Candidatus Saccharibacteria bacterium]|nr:hypothetical protein [Candidatus Saccharibacteria bacterium]